MFGACSSLDQGGISFLVLILDRSAAGELDIVMQLALARLWLKVSGLDIEGLWLWGVHGPHFDSSRAGLGSFESVSKSTAP